MTHTKTSSPKFVQCDLRKLRAMAQNKKPAVHQQAALGMLSKWYHRSESQGHGGILVLPTGGGKTYTAVHFCSSLALSNGDKVLWLAHTHHLLEQALIGFRDGAGLITEPKDKLSIRVVSGLQGEHFPAHSIQATDDVVISSLATVRLAMKTELKAFTSFLESSKGRLMVVFDEAHHAPAPSYRKFLQDLRKKYPQMKLLGLTATPVYGEAKKEGWLKEIFPQGIIHQVTARQLMASGILAKPVFHSIPTNFEPDVSQPDLQKWLSTHSDIPEGVITKLAESKVRNDYIVHTYVKGKEKWGKTIIFADRWYQCDYLREALQQRGVRADVVYSHVDSDPGTVEERNKRDTHENTRTLQEFKDDKLDVLINVKMLTEGTDFPSVRTVFLTRQTTSPILLTQMVGRALRGEKFGGTSEANIVSFFDNWNQGINWAEFAQITGGEMEDESKGAVKRPPLHLISIALVRRLARQMDTGTNTNSGPFTKTFLPLGWYQAEFTARVAGTEDEEMVQQQIMVFDGARSSYEQFLAQLLKDDLSAFEENDFLFDDARGQVEAWQKSFFSAPENHIGSDLLLDLFALASHIAQNGGRMPLWIPFDAHKQHDLDQVAEDHIEQKLDILQVDEQVRKEFERSDRYWSVFYSSYSLFKSHYDGCVNRLLQMRRSSTQDPKPEEAMSYPDSVPTAEPSEELKKLVKQRDGRCLCCGRTRQLRIDHIRSRYLGGTHDPNNLQTLCVKCNTKKNIDEIDFRLQNSPLTKASETLVPNSLIPSDEESMEEWKFWLRAKVNLFYSCGAVEQIKVGNTGESLETWHILLHPGNNRTWLMPHLPALVKQIRLTREENGLPLGPKKIVIN